MGEEVARITPGIRTNVGDVRGICNVQKIITQY